MAASPIRGGVGLDPPVGFFLTLQPNELPLQSPRGVTRESETLGSFGSKALKKRGIACED
jgi:hypothetical protein